MSTYLLLRNNKESGPHTLEALMGMSLKAYDLVWVEGKSAAWRYPGEITELKAFAPEVVEQPFDRFFKKPTEQTAPELPASIPAANVREQATYAPKPMDSSKARLNRSVYINMPAAVAARTAPVAPIDYNSVSLPAFSQSLSGVEPVPIKSAPAQYNAMPAPVFSQPQKTWNKPLLAAGIIILFCMGIITGYFISRPGISSTPAESLSVAKKNMVAAVDQRAANVSAASVPVANISLSGDPLVLDSARLAKTVKSLVAVKSHKQKMTAVPADSLQDKKPVATETESKPLPVPASPPPVDHIEQMVSVKSDKYSVGTFGGISGLKLTVSNQAPAMLDLVVVEIQYIQSNKKIFKTENVYFHHISPGSALLQAAPSSSRGVKIKYRISMINTKQVDLSFSDM